MDEQKNTRTLYIVGAITILVLAGALLAWQTGFTSRIFGARMPSLDREVTFPADFPESGKQLFTENLGKIKEKLQQNPDAADVWLDLAITYRTVGDNEGAVQIWKYLSAVKNPNAVALHDLGEYYFHNEKDYPKAEDYYKKSIAAMPTLAANYSDMHEMYRYAYKQDTSAAVDIINEGAKAVDGLSAINLLKMLSDYYVSVGKKSDAIATLERARTSAKAAGENMLVRQLDQQIAQLKK